MSQLKILQIGSISDRFDERLARDYESRRLWNEQDKLVFLEREGASFDAVVTSSRSGCTAEVIEALPNLKAICNFGVGYDSIDVAAAQARGVVISNTPDVLTECVADLAFGLILDVARRLSEGDRFVRAGQWLHGNFPLGSQVFRKRLGIVGLGRIGRAVARRASGFEMEIGYHNRRRVDSLAYRYENSVAELAQWADFLVVACVGGPQTRCLISACELAALGPKGVLINVSRGTVVDEEALVAALQKGEIGGAGLDVYADEPNVPEPLLAMSNVVLLPHVGSGTVETRLAMEQLVFDNLAAFAATGAVLTPVAG